MPYCQRCAFLFGTLLNRNWLACCYYSRCYIAYTWGGRVARRYIPDFDIFGRVKICDYAYIGSGAQIMPGVTIGEGSLVAAGSIVTRSVPAGVVVAGNPAKSVCTVEEYIERNKKYNLGTKNLSAEEKKKVLLSLSPDRLIVK